MITTEDIKSLSKRLKDLQKKIPVEHTIEISECETVSDYKLFVNSHYRIVDFYCDKRRGLNPVFKPYYDRLVRFCEVVELVN